MKNLKDEEDVLGLNHFELTEFLRDILTDITSHYSREIWHEQEKDSPDVKLIEEYLKKEDEFLLVLHDSSNFTSGLNRMQELINQYLPLAKEINGVK